MARWIPALGLALSVAACQAEGSPVVADTADDGDGAPRVLTGPWPETQPGGDAAGARHWYRAGDWYPEDPSALSRAVADLLADASPPAPRRARAILTPHASLNASGPIAAEVYGRVTAPDVALVIAPNHARHGDPAAIWPGGPWLMPGVALQTDDEASGRLEELAQGALSFDAEAFEHDNAHPSEMQMPFISRLFPEAMLVVVSLFDNQAVIYPDTDLGALQKLGDAVAELVTEIEEGGREVLLIGTTDLSHYQPAEVAEKQDAELMPPIEAFDEEGLEQVVRGDELSICGEVAVTIWTQALRQLGYSKLDFAVRGDSRKVTGSDAVVGYPGGIVWRATD